MSREPKASFTGGAPGAARKVLARAPLFAALWLVLTEGDVRYWGLALLVIVAAAAVSLRLVPGPSRPHAGAMFALLRYFLAYSLRGGWDVATRAFRRRPALEPGFVDYSPALSGESQRTFFLLIVGLMPGTLCTERRGPAIRIHVLDTSMEVLPQLHELERRVGRAFGQSGAGEAPPAERAPR